MLADSLLFLCFIASHSRGFFQTIFSFWILVSFHTVLHSFVFENDHSQAPIPVSTAQKSLHTVSLGIFNSNLRFSSGSFLQLLHTFSSKFRSHHRVKSTHVKLSSFHSYPSYFQLQIGFTGFNNFEARKTKNKKQKRKRKKGTITSLYNNIVIPSQL